MVRMTVRQQLAGVALLAMIAATGCQQQAAGPKDKSGGAADASQPGLREITLKITGLT